MAAAAIIPESIFDQAIAIADEELRAAYLNQACSGDDKLRHEAERLVCAHFRAGNFLEQPAIAIDFTTPLREQYLGATIGPYKLLQQIGEGGMGVVYMAQQTQPVKRKVALKIIKPGMDTKEVIARFESERQALALMDHPSIAKVFDAGSTDSGRPYFVMELVKGLSITDYCRENRLSIDACLSLFIQVCSAVQHAHQKGIIHRDLKPSNVMVTLHGDQPLPKVIDFGVAKAMSQQLTERTLFTAYGQMIGTPAYMSPEQAAISGLDIDTRSDVYSLGVLLYELLTGTTPFETERLKSVGFDEMRRIIREEEPETVSTRLARTRRVGVSPAQSSRQTPSDAGASRFHPSSFRLHPFQELDWIVTKTLEKDRTRRYESASSLARDIERYLNGDLVQACPPSTAYRFRKFARKNKAALTTASLLAASLLLGTTVSLWQAIRATRANAVAQENQASAERNLAEANEARKLADKRLHEVDQERKRAQQNFDTALAAR